MRPSHRQRTRSDHVSRDSPSGGAAGAAAGAARLVSPVAPHVRPLAACVVIFTVLFAETSSCLAIRYLALHRFVG